MDEFKPSGQQIIPPEPGSTFQIWAESLPILLLPPVLWTLLNAQMAVAEIENRVLAFTPPAYKGALEINPPKSCPNDLLTNRELETLLIKAGLPANAEIINIVGQKVRYSLGNCQEVFTADIRHTRNGHLALTMKAPALPTKIKPKN